MKYNVFDGYDKMNEEPLALGDARRLKEQIEWRRGYNIITTRVCIQGIYQATRRGFAKFLDDMGWEEYGQRYSSFVYAMENDEKYCN